MITDEDEKENRTFKAPIKRNQTVLYSRLGYHRYFKVNSDVDLLLFRQNASQWYKFDYLLYWDDNTTSVYVDGQLLSTQPFYMGLDPLSFG